MFEFLRRHSERGPTDEVGGLLGNLSLLLDGSPPTRRMPATGLRRWRLRALKRLLGSLGFNHQHGAPTFEKPLCFGRFT